MTDWHTEEHWTPDPVIAYRGWTWNGEFLIGPNKVPWESKTMKAVHVDKDHVSPHPGCLCGINAYKDVLMARPYPILGKIALTGTVDEYEEGYRASDAEILEIFIYAKYNTSLDWATIRDRMAASGPFPVEKMDRQIEKIYQVPVHRGKRIGWRKPNEEKTHEEQAAWQK
jgi:hypothetical protein